MKPIEGPPRERLDAFDTAWKMCEEKGRCDAFGGAEYRRIREVWQRIMGVLYAVDLIAYHANRPPTRSGGKDGAK